MLKIKTHRQDCCNRKADDSVCSGKEISDVVILIEKNKITGVGSNLKIPDSVQIIALCDITLLPGLIDAHTHLLHQYYTRYGDDNSNRLLEMIQLDLLKKHYYAQG